MASQFHTHFLRIILILISLLGLAACQAEGTLSATATPPTTPMTTTMPPTPPPAEGESAVTIEPANVTAVSATSPQDGQVIVTLTGQYPDGCTSLHEISTSYTDHTVTIDVTTSRPTDMLCTQQIVPFEEQITLDVADRPDGTYTVMANEAETTFTLGEMAMEPNVTISPMTGGPGTEVNLTATGLPADVPVQIGLGRVDSEYDVIETAETAPSGELDMLITFPDFAHEQGEWVFVVETPAREKYISNVFTITAADVTRVDIYLIALEDDGVRGPRAGCGDSLVPTTVDIAEAEDPLPLAALEALLALTEQTHPDSGLYNALYRSDLSVTEFELENGQATIYLRGDLQMGGACDAPRVAAQLRQTVLQFDSVSDVTYYINGNLMDALLDARGLRPFLYHG